MNNEIDKGNDQAKRCAQCRRDLDLGVDAVGIQQGVIGPRGFVPLEDMRLLCGENCLRNYVCDGTGEAERLSRRVP